MGPAPGAWESQDPVLTGCPFWEEIPGKEASAALPSWGRGGGSSSQRGEGIWGLSAHFRRTGWKLQTGCISKAIATEPALGPGFVGMEIRQRRLKPGPWTCSQLVTGSVMCPTPSCNTRKQSDLILGGKGC